jgi:hypothetical protein
LPIKQINENRQARSEAFDQLHLKFTKQLRHYVRQCDNLQVEIEEREILRSKLVNISMEIKNRLEQDYTQSLEKADEEAKLPIDKILGFFKQFSLGDKQATALYLLDEINHAMHAQNGPMDHENNQATVLDEHSVKMLTQILKQSLVDDDKMKFIHPIGKFSTDDMEENLLDNDKLSELKIETPAKDSPRNQLRQDLNQLSVYSSISLDTLPNESSLVAQEAIVTPHQPPIPEKPSLKPKPSAHRKVKKNVTSELPPKPPLTTTLYSIKEKNLVDEFFKYVDERSKSNYPLAETKRYLSSIQRDFEASIDELFPDLKLNFQALLKEPFNENSLDDIHHKLEVISLQQPLTQMEVSQQENTDKMVRNAPTVLQDLIFRQSLDAILAGTDAIRGLQENCALVAENAIHTVKQFLFIGFCS